MEEILTLEEVAGRFKVSVKTVRRLIASGKLRAFKVGGQRRVFGEHLKEYLKRQMEGAGAR